MAKNQKNSRNLTLSIGESMSYTVKCFIYLKSVSNDLSENHKIIRLQLAKIWAEFFMVILKKFYRYTGFTKKYSIKKIR